MANRSKYTKEIHNWIVTVITGGGTHRAAARSAGVTPETLSHWKNQYPDFREDIARAEAKAQAFAEMLLYDLGRKGNLKALTHWLARRHPSEWGDKRQANDTDQWPDTPEGWAAKREELEAKCREWQAKHGVPLGPESATAESARIQRGGANGSKPAPSAAPGIGVQEPVTPMKSSGNGDGVHADYTCRADLDDGPSNSAGNGGRIR